MSEQTDIFEPSCQSWAGEAVLVDSKRLLGVHKYKDMTKVRPVIMKAAESAINKAQAICSPIGRHRIIEIRSLNDASISLVGGYEFECRAFAQHLTNCTHVLIFAITLGSELDETVSEGFADGTDPLGPLFLDTAGWLTLEAATRDFVSEQKAELMKRAYTMTLRMAPGYSYAMKDEEERVEWALTDQQALFVALECEDMPIQLLESSAMLPRMSRSGMFGIRSNSEMKSE